MEIKLKRKIKEAVAPFGEHQFRLSSPKTDPDQDFQHLSLSKVQRRVQKIGKEGKLPVNEKIKMQNCCSGSNLWQWLRESLEPLDTGWESVRERNLSTQNVTRKDHVLLASTKSLEHARTIIKQCTRALLYCYFRCVWKYSFTSSSLKNSKIPALQTQVSVLLE